MLENKVNIHGRKAAGVTLELILGISLAVLVLFFVLNIFSDNLKTMVANSSMHNMWDKSEKTTYGKEAFDPTQVNVQVLAEQGNTLQWYIEQAAAEIDKYKDTPPATLAEVEDLAKWATIARITSGTQVLTTGTDGLATKFYNAYGIYINNINSSYITQIMPVNSAANKVTDSTASTYKQFTYNSTGGGRLDAPSNQLAASKAIYDAQYTDYKP